jgi:hypothetical protein
MSVGCEAARQIIGVEHAFVDERIDHPVFAVQSSAGVIDLFATEQSGVEEKIENVVFVRGKHEERNWRLGLDLANSGTDSKRSGTRVSPAMIF